MKRLYMIISFHQINAKDEFILPNSLSLIQILLTREHRYTLRGFRTWI